MIVQWCNGSTTGFGSVCGGSNPPWTTILKPRDICFKCKRLKISTFHILTNITGFHLIKKVDESYHVKDTSDQFVSGKSLLGHDSVTYAQLTKMLRALAWKNSFKMPYHGYSAIANKSSILT